MRLIGLSLGALPAENLQIDSTAFIELNAFLFEKLPLLLRAGARADLAFGVDEDFNDLHAAPPAT